MNIKIDPNSHIPLYQQIIDEIISLIASGRIKIGEKVPSIRKLSEELDVNPATIVRAYRSLEDMGVLNTRKGKRSEVAGLPIETKEETLHKLYRDFLIEVKKVGYTEKEVIDTVSNNTVNTILAIDVGSTTTKSILFKRDSKGRMVFRGFNQSKTTVETIEEDVWVGITKSIKGLEEKTDWKMLKNGDLRMPSSIDHGIDMFIATSSAGGGLQMITFGLVTFYTAQSSERAALGAGAIVMDVFAIDDNKTPFEKILELKELHPDIILLSGGVEDGAISGVVQLGEILSSSEIKGKFGDYKIPLVYAGNTKGREFIDIALKNRFELYITENIRPKMDLENLSPARDEIRRIFMDHVMKRAPGYEKLLNKVSSPILPTPGAIFELLSKYSKHIDKNILAFDVGGATTDVFSTYDKKVIRTVCANIGMSYSLLQTIKRTTLQNIIKWIPEKIDELEFENIAANKMISPTSLPKNELEKEMEIAIAKEILKISYEDHKRLAEKEHEEIVTFESLFKGEDQKPKEKDTGKSELNPLMIDMIIGSGGILSHLERKKSLEILLDGYNAKGITEFYVDSSFMMPQLGVLSSVNPALGLELFERECMVPLCTIVSPIGIEKEGKLAFTLIINEKENIVKFGDFIRIPVYNNMIKIKVLPTKKFDAGFGKGISVNKIIHTGQFGIICDMRSRPIKPTPEKIKRWRNIISGVNNV